MKKAAYFLAALLAFGCDDEGSSNADPDMNTGGATGGAGAEGGSPGGAGGMGGEPMGGEPMGGEPMGGMVGGAGGEPMGGEPMGGEPMTEIDLEITTPQEGDFFSSSQVNVAGTVDPEVPVTVNEQDVVVQDGAFTTTNVYPEGANTATVVATAPDGSSEEASVNFTVDTVSPLISVDSPADGDVIDGDMVSVVGSVADATMVTVSINGDEVALDGGAFDATVMLVPGANVIELEAVDQAGNVTLDEINVTRLDLAGDNDGDGLTNGDELERGTDPENPDTDGDGLDDGREVNELGTSPLLADTDEGGVDDGQEVLRDNTDPLNPEDDAGLENLPITLTDADGYEWTIAGNGSIATGEEFFFEDTFELFIGEEEQFPTQLEGRVINAGREVLLGPANMGGLSVSRRVFISEEQGFARFLEVLRNDGAEPVNAVVNVRGHLSAGGFGLAALTAEATSFFDEPEDQFNFLDDWVVISGDESDSLVTHLFSQEGADVDVEQALIVGDGEVGGTEWRFDFPVSVQPGEQIIIMHLAGREENVEAAEELTGDFTGSNPEVARGMLNAERLQVRNLRLIPDTDQDGLNDEEEIEFETDPLNPDTDGDGLLDGFEALNGFDPLGGEDGPLDPDEDGLTNLQEQGTGTDPNNPDTDADGLTDAEEVNGDPATNPLRADSDRDGLRDARELELGTDPNLADTDGGGRLDGPEVDIDGTDPLDPADDTEPVVFPDFGGFVITDGTGFEWDIEPDGRISDGSSDAYDGGLNLSVGEAAFPDLDENAVLTLNGRQMVIGPARLDGLDVFRKIYVPDAEGVGYARFMEVLVNPTLEPIETTVALDSNLGSDGGTILVATSTGGEAVGPADDWMITDDGPDGQGFDPTTTHVFSGVEPFVEPDQASQVGDNLSWSYPVTVPAGGRAIILHFAAQTNNQVDALALAPVLHTPTPDSDLMFGATVDELLAVVNFNVRPDLDNDGLPDGREVELGTDPENPDTDGDGLLDGYEVDNGLDPLVADNLESDLDEDGLTLGEEFEAGTNPTLADTDGDGVNDGDEVGGDPATNPLNPDTDGDGLLDGAEAETGTNPTLADTDEDGLLDGQEVNETLTDPLSADTDEDGMEDGYEVEFGLDPLVDDGDDDLDMDGLINRLEGGLGTNPNDPDSDGDGLPDGVEDANQNGVRDEGETDATLADTDGGGRDDFGEIELDGTDPLNPEDDVVVVEFPAFGGINLNDGNGFIWDLQPDGNFSNGSNDAYDGGERLFIDDAEFPDQDVAVEAYDGRGYVLGGAEMSGLQVVRKLYVPEAEGVGFARYLEMLNNPTGEDIQVTVRIQGNLGSDGGTVQVASSVDDGAFTVEDDWVISDDANAAGGDPTMSHVFSDGRADVQPSEATFPANDDDYAYSFEVTVPANGRAIVMHFARQSADRDIAQAEIGNLAEPDEAALFGVPQSERNDIVNFSLLPDADEDGVPDEVEVQLGTDPNNPDTDGDGLDDGYEVDNGLDPLVADDVDGDVDEDGLTLAEEADLGTDPGNADTDGDSVEDGDEVAAGTDPLNPDSDGDGLNDGAEAEAGTDPLNPDTDGGGRDDFGEVEIDGTNPLDPEDDVVLVEINGTLNLNDGAGFLWDMQSVGSFSNGSNDAYDGGQRLFIDDAQFPAQDIAVETYGGRGYILGGAEMSGLQVLRKVYVTDFEGLGFARHLELLNNPTGEDIQVTVSIQGNMGSDGSTELVATSVDDGVFDPEDDWLISDDGDGADGFDPAVTHVFSDANAAVQPDAVLLDSDNYNYNFVVTVPANGRAIIMHFASQATTRAEALGNVEALAAPADLELFGITPDERNDVVNFSLLPDADADGVPDEVEAQLGTDPENPDTDGDGLLDGYEVDNGLDPLVADDVDGDVDEDGLTLGEEAEIGTDPTVGDTDEDGVSDGDEVNGEPATDPLNPDTDGDGLTDGAEADAGTDPTLADSDEGGRNDFEELEIDGTDPLNPEDDVIVVDFPDFGGIVLVDATEFDWDVGNDGTIGDGETDTYDTAFILSVDDQPFPDFDDAVELLGGQELVIGAAELSGVQVVRRVYVPAEGEVGFARFLEVFNNPTGEDIELVIDIDGNLGSDGATELVATSNDDGAFAIDDDYIITDDADNGGDSVATHIFSDPIAAVQPDDVLQVEDDINIGFTLTVPANGRAILMHFGVQTADRVTAFATLDSLLALDPAVALVGMSEADIADVVNLSVGPLVP